MEALHGLTSGIDSIQALLSMVAFQCQKLSIITMTGWGFIGIIAKQIPIRFLICLLARK